MNKISTNPVYRFGEFTLDTGRAALFLGDEELRLRRRTFEVLTYLVRNSGRLVSKQELFEAVWGAPLSFPTLAARPRSPSATSLRRGLAAAGALRTSLRPRP